MFKRKLGKSVLTVILSIMMVLEMIVPCFTAFAAANDEYQGGAGTKISDLDTSTKYSESLGQNEAKDDATKCQERDVAVSLGVFTKDAEERIASGKIPLTQIYRNFLLSEAYGRKEGLESYSIILAPSIHPSTSDEVASLYNELKEEHRDKLREVHLEDFVDALIDTSPEEYSRLFRDFRARYLDFEKAKLTLSDK